MSIKKIITSLILIITLVLALIAGFTAFKLYETTKKTEISPSPSEQTKPPEVFVETVTNPCELSFAVTAVSSASPSPSTPSLTCGSVCTANNCPSNLTCQSLGYCNNTSKSACTSNSDCPNGVTCQLQSICVNSNCPRDNDCVCPSSSPPASPSPSASIPPSPSPTFYPASPLPSSSGGRTIIGASPLPGEPKGGVAEAPRPKASQASAQPTGPAETLPSAGITTPTILLVLGGVVLITLGILL